MRNVHAVIVVIVALVVTTAAQSTRPTGKLTGTIVDEAGAGMPGVAITLGNQTAMTDKDGRFELTAFRGTHELRARLRGFSTIIYKVTVGEKSAPVKIQMRPAKLFPIVFVGDTPERRRP